MGVNGLSSVYHIDNFLTIVKLDTTYDKKYEFFISQFSPYLLPNHASIVKVVHWLDLAVGENLIDGISTVNSSKKKTFIQFTDNNNFSGKEKISTDSDEEKSINTIYLSEKQIGLILTSTSFVVYFK